MAVAENDVDLLISSQNIAENLDDKQLIEIGRRAVNDFDTDKDSRSDWEERYEGALKLAAQVVEERTYPWKNSANVKYPLLTTACIQFSARAYPALVLPINTVKCKTIGRDIDGSKDRRADRISKHMSYQVLEEMKDWEEDMDRLLTILPLTGTEFKKTYFDAQYGVNVSEHVLAKDLVVNYYAKSLETAPRITHILHMYPNEIRERVLSGIFLDEDLGEPSSQKDRLQEASDEIQGKVEPGHDEDAPYEILEQHRFLDLDNDGYQEPYIVVVERESQKVLRIVARFDQSDVVSNEKGQIIKINPVHYFTKFSFVPSMDGGFYDFGYGLLLGPINEAANTLINQLLDAGTLSNLQSGFLSKGIRFKGGNHRFTPGEWKPVDSYGDDLRKGIYPLPVREPSQTLFQLLGMLISAGEKLGSSVDLLSGESPGQNQPATTTVSLIEQGLKVFGAIYKRLHRSLKKEYHKLYRLNRIYLPDQVYFTIVDPGQEEMMEIQRGDYDGDPTDVSPASDPAIASEAQKLARAEALIQAMNAGAPYNPQLVWKQYAEALNLPAVDALMTLPEPQPNPQLLIEQAKLEVDNAKVKIEQGKLQLAAEKIKQEAQIKTYDIDTRAQVEREKMALEQGKLELEAGRDGLEREIEAGKQQLERERQDMEERHNQAMHTIELEKIRADVEKADKAVQLAKEAAEKAEENESKKEGSGEKEAPAPNITIVNEARVGKREAYKKDGKWIIEDKE